MIVSINEAYDEFYFYTNVNPFEENRGEEEQVDYDFLYNQKHIIERKEDSNRNYDDDDDDLESVGKNDLYHYHFGDYYESINSPAGRFNESHIYIPLMRMRGTLLLIRGIRWGSLISRWRINDST